MLFLIYYNLTSGSPFSTEIVAIESEREAETNDGNHCAFKIVYQTHGPAAVQMHRFEFAYSTVTISPCMYEYTNLDT